MNTKLQKFMETMLEYAKRTGNAVRPEGWWGDFFTLSIICMFLGFTILDWGKVTQIFLFAMGGVTLAKDAKSTLRDTLNGIKGTYKWGKHPDQNVSVLHISKDKYMDLRRSITQVCAHQISDTGKSAMLRKDSSDAVEIIQSGGELFIAPQEAPFSISAVSNNTIKHVNLQSSKGVSIKENSKKGGNVQYGMDVLGDKYQILFKSNGALICENKDNKMKTLDVSFNKASLPVRSAFLLSNGLHLHNCDAFLSDAVDLGDYETQNIRRIMSKSLSTDMNVLPTVSLKTSDGTSIHNVIVGIIPEKLHKSIVQGITTAVSATDDKPVIVFTRNFTSRPGIKLWYNKNGLNIDTSQRTYMSRADHLLQTKWRMFTQELSALNMLKSLSLMSMSLAESGAKGGYAMWKSYRANQESEKKDSEVTNSPITDNLAHAWEKAKTYAAVPWKKEVPQEHPKKNKLWHRLKKKISKKKNK